MEIQKRKSIAMYLLGFGAGVMLTGCLFLRQSSTHRLATYVSIVGATISVCGTFVRPTAGGKWA